MQAIAAMIEDRRNTLGVVHLGLYGSKHGLILSWKQSLEAIAEPSELYTDDCRSSASSSSKEMSLLVR